MPRRNGRRQRGARKPTWDLDRVDYVKLTLGLTDEALAVASNLCPQTIANVLSGRSVTPTTMKKIADALGIPLAELVIPVGGRRLEGRTR